jgi:hypothetical protein
VNEALYGDILKKVDFDKAMKKLRGDLMKNGCNFL